MAFKAPQEFMVEHPVLGLGSGNNGCFIFHYEKETLLVIASDGGGWEHVSVSSNKRRCPTWEEMCFIKDYFWGENDTVVQFHPPRAEYVNNHNYCLHLWRPTNINIPTPNSLLVGIKESNLEL